MEDKKTLAFVIGSLSSGGAERVVSNLSNQLVNTYHIVIITFISTPPFYPLDDRITLVHCVDKITPSKSVWQALKTNALLLRKIIGFVKFYEVNVALGFLTTPNVLTVIAARFTGIPVIISERNNPYLTDNTLPRFWKLLRTLCYPFSDYLVVQTETIKKYYTKKINSKKLVIIPNPINPDFEQFNVELKENIILNVGRLTDQKDQQMLIHVFAKLNPINWKLHIVGEGHLRNALQKLIIEKEMKDKIILLGQSTNIEKHYNNSKIFVFTSKFEGFPNALLEAMHFGLACVSTDCPSGPAELIKDGENGILVPVGNELQLMANLKLLIENKETRTRLGKAGQKSVQKYSIKKITAHWESLIQA